MNYRGYKWLDEAKTRRSGEVIRMSPKESLPQFKKRCELLGFDIVSDDIKMTISEALSEKEQIINTEEYENEL